MQLLAVDVQNEHVAVQVKTCRLHTATTAGKAWTLCASQVMPALQSVLSPCGVILYTITWLKDGSFTPSPDTVTC